MTTPLQSLAHETINTITYKKLGEIFETWTIGGGKTCTFVRLYEKGEFDDMFKKKLNVSILKLRKS